MTDTAADSLAFAEQGVALIDALVNTKESLQAFTKLTTALTLAGPAFALLGGILSFVVPDEKHEQILNEFKKLNDKINLVRDDIKNLDIEMKWELTKLHYMDKVRVVLLAIEYSQNIAENTKDDDRKEYFKKKLLDLCENEDCLKALKAIIDGLVGKKGFHMNILHRYYGKTKGNRPELIKLSIKFMRIVSGGFISVMAYELLQHGQIGAEILAEEYTEDMKRVVKATKDVVNRCTSEFKTNMQIDLEEEMGRQSDHKQLSITLRDKFSSKYDWMNIAALVYNDIGGYDSHTFSGYFVSKLRHHSKNAIVFYWDKAYGFRNKAKMNELRNAAKTGQTYLYQGFWSSYTKHYTRAKNVWDKISGSHGSQLWGMAVIKRYVGLWYATNSGSRVVWDLGKKFTVCLLVK